MPSLSLLKLSLSDIKTPHKWILSQLDSPQSPSQKVLTEQRRLLRLSSSNASSDDDGVPSSTGTHCRHHHLPSSSLAHQSMTESRDASVSSVHRRYMRRHRTPSSMRSTMVDDSTMSSQSGSILQRRSPRVQSRVSARSRSTSLRANIIAPSSLVQSSHSTSSHSVSTPSLSSRSQVGPPQRDFSVVHTSSSCSINGISNTAISSSVNAEPTTSPSLSVDAIGGGAHRRLEEDSTSSPSHTKPSSHGVFRRKQAKYDKIYNQACQLYSSKQYSEAFHLFRKIATRHAKAAYNCANMCRDGLGMESTTSHDEYGRCLECLRNRQLSADSITPLPPIHGSQVQCAHHKSNRSQKNIKEAIKYYTCAIKLDNHPRAMFNLANLYRERGKLDKAISLYKRACMEKHERSWTKLGNIYIAKRKYRKARKCYEKGIEFGHASAWRNMGICFEKGLGVKEDLLMARELYEEATRRQAHQADFLLQSCEKKILSNQTCVGMI